MTREEAIKHLSEWMDEKMWRCFGTIDREAIGMAIEALKEQEISNELQEYAYECGYEHFFHECQSCEHRRIGNKAQDWIPCSERLPSEIGTIIVTLLDKKYGECFVDDEWWDGDMFLNFGKPFSGYEVTAWMPYPKPYRKDDK